MKALRLAIILLFLFSGQGFSQVSNSNIFYIKELPAKGIQLNKGWVFFPGDNDDYAKYDLNENNGTPINPALVLEQLPLVQQSGIGWFRLKLQVDSTLRNKTIGMTISLFGAAEIYLNGEKVYQFGIVSDDYNKEKTQAIYAKALNIKFGSDEQQILAVRYSFTPKNMYAKGYTVPPCLRIILSSSDQNFNTNALLAKHVYLYIGITLTIVLASAVLNLFYFFSFPARKEYLYFGLFFLCEFIGVLVQSDLLGTGKTIQLSTNETIILVFLADLFIIPGSLLSLHGIRILFKGGSIKFYRFLQWYALLSLMAIFIVPVLGGFPAILVLPLVCFEAMRICYKAARRDISGAWIIFVSSLVSLLLMIFVTQAILVNDLEYIYLMICLSIVASAMGLVIFLAGDFASTSAALRGRISEVEELSKKTIAQEKEKQEILALQKDILEQEVKERTAELSKSLSDLKATQAQLIQSEKMASLGELTAGIAHEIQNPLNFVNNFSEVNTELIEELKNELKEGNNEEVASIADDIKANEEKINHHGKRADAIVKGMLQHSRSNTGIKEPTDINSLADEYLRLSYQGLRAKDKSINVTMQTDFDENIRKINIIPQEIGRVLLNLYNNAFYTVAEKKKHTSTGSVQNGYEPTVSVSTIKENGIVELCVKDNGSGIPQKVVDKIFQPFFTTKPTGQGTGLGLSLAYDIIKAHGGEIKVETKEGEGSEFIVQLPVNHFRKSLPPLLLFFILPFFSCTAYSQDTLVDSLKKDSLKKVLQSQKEDTAKINTLNQLSLYLNNAGELEEGYKTAREIMTLATKLDYTDGKGKAMHRIGNYYEYTDKYEEARQRYDSALQYFIKTGNKDDQANVYGSIASSYNGEQNPAVALEYIYRSLKLYEETGNEQGLAGAYLFLGSNNLQEKDYAAATRNLTAALEVFKKANDKLAIAVINSMLAEGFLEQNKFQEALQLDSVALKIYDDEASVYNKGGVFRNRAKIYEKQGDILRSQQNYEQAKNKYRSALQEYIAATKIFEQTNTKEFFFYNRLDIGNIYIKLNNPETARKHLDETFQYLSGLDQKTKKNYNGWFEKYYFVLSKLDSADGNSARAYEHYKIYISYRDSSNSEEKAKRIQELKLQYDFGKKETLAKAEQANKDAETRRTRNLQYTALGGFLLLAIFLFWNNRQKQKAKTKIEKAYTELKATQQQLIQSEKMASLGELTAGIAHEIQNPLNFVNNFSEVNKELLEELKDEADKGNMDEVKVIANDVIDNEQKINHHGKRADAIVKGMLLHSQRTAGQKELTDINKLADEYLRLSYQGLRAKDKSFNVTLQTFFDESIGKINIIPQEIGRVLLNLYNNAFYTVAEKKKLVGDSYEPTISVSTIKENGKVEVCVKDNGNGIPQKIVDKIFQPFFTTKPTGQGTGLGLSLAYDIIKAHGGEIKVESKEGEGSRFIVQIPGHTSS